MQTIESKGLSKGSLFKLLFTGLFPLIFILGVGCGIAALAGYSTVTLNNQYVFGMKGLITGVIIGLVLPIVMASFMWVIMAIGIWIWTRFKRITLIVKD